MRVNSKSNPWIRAKDFLIAAVMVITTSQIIGSTVTHSQRNFPILINNSSRDCQRYRRQQLIGNSEQRPQRIDSTQWIDYALI